ncbi:MAG: nuclear transport factor 2 family protein [Bacteroidales bacterium]|nr:nuclear transport factor 2 family protein [Bacteroidales bacterium]
MTLEQKAAVADTISMLMNQLIASAEATDPVETGAMLLMDSTSMFFINGIPYSHSEMLTKLDSNYTAMEWQKINFEFSQVYVLSPDAALWVGYGTNVFPLGDAEVSCNLANTFLWQKKHGQWRVSHFHESGVPVVSEEVED